MWEHGAIVLHFADDYRLSGFIMIRRAVG